MLNKVINAIALTLFVIWVSLLVFEALIASQQIPSEQQSHGASAPNDNIERRVEHDQSHTDEKVTKRKTKEHQATHALKEFFVGFVEIKLTDLLIAVFTIVLAVKTAGLFRETAGLREAAENQRLDSLRSIKAAEMAADAALRQANAMVALESPIPGIVQLKLVAYPDEQSDVATVDPVPPGVPPQFCRPLVMLENRGRTEMTVHRFCCDWIVAPAVEEVPDYSFVEIWNGGLAKESSVWVKSQNGIRLDWEQARTIGDFGAFLWVYGYFTYSNFMGEKSTIGYIARWDISKGFVREPLAQYEYQRKA
jgi:hypothetical protein